MKKEPVLFEMVVPIFNEERELEEHIGVLVRFFVNKFADKKWNICIVDNASTDQSLEIAKKLSKKFERVSYLHLNEKGRGRAVRAAWLQSDAKIVAYTDVDLSTDLNSFSLMVKNLEEGFDIAIASRLLNGSTVENRTFTREIISRLYNVLLKLFFQVRFSDAQCGFKAIKRDIFVQLAPCIKNQEWFFDTEMLIIAEKMGFRIFECPVVWRDNPGSTVRVLPTMMEDLRGVVRLFLSRPWRKNNHE